MRVRVNRRRNGFGLAAAAWIVSQAGGIQHFCRLAAELIQLAVRNKQGIRQVNVDMTRVVKGLPQLRHAILQVVKGFFRVVCHLEQTIKRMRHADTVFTGHGQDQLLFPAAQFNVHRDTTFARGFQQRLLPVVVKVTVQCRVRARFVEIRRHLVWPYAIAIFTGFFHRIRTEAHHFTLDHHVQSIAVGQRLGHFHVEVIFCHFQHFTHR